MSENPPPSKCFSFPSRNSFLHFWNALIAFCKEFYETGKLPDLSISERIKILQEIETKNANGVKTIKKVGRFTRGLAEIRLRYLRDFFLEDQVQGVSLILQMWRAGQLGRIGLIAIIVGILAAPFFIMQSPVQVSAENPVIPLPVLFIAILGILLAWSYALTLAISLPMWAYIIVCAYASWYGLLIGVGLRGTVAAALPVFWMLYIGWHLSRTTEERWNRLWLFLLCMGSSFLTFGSLGFYRISGETYYVPGVIALGVVYYGLLQNPISLRTKLSPLKPHQVFWGTVGVVFSFFLLAYLRQKEEFSQHTLLSLRSLLGIVDIFWMWLGATLLEWALGLGEWISDEVAHVIPDRIDKIILPSLWLLFFILGWIALYPVPLSVLAWKYQTGLQPWIDNWEIPDYYTVQIQVIVSLLILLVVLILKANKRLTMENIGKLNGVWIACFLAFLGYYQSLMGFETLEADSIPPSSAWLALLLIFGILWEMGISVQYYWSSQSRGRLYAVITLLLIMLSIITITLGAGLTDLIMEYTFYSFQGILYLGIPVAVYVFISGQTSYQPVEKTKLIGLFLLGSLSAAVVLMIDPYAGWHLFMVPLLWVLILIIFGKKLGRLECWQDGIFAGGALAFGFVTFWMSPEVIPVPFATFFQTLQDTYLSANLARPLLLPGQLWLTLLVVAAAVPLGILFSLPRHLPHKIIFTLLASAVFAFGIPILPDIPTEAPAPAEQSLTSPVNMAAISDNHITAEFPK